MNMPATPTKLTLVKGIIATGRFYDRKTFFPKFFYLREPSGIPGAEYNARGLWGEAEVFVQDRLGCGVHPQVIEYAVLRELDHFRDDYSWDFLNASYRILHNLDFAGALRGVPSFLHYADFARDTERRCEFQLDMAERFSNGGLMRLQGSDVEIDRYFAIFPPLSRKAYQTLVKMREYAEQVIEECSQESKAMMTKIAEDRAKCRTALPESPEIISHGALDDPFVTAALYGDTRRDRTIAFDDHHLYPKHIRTTRQPLVEGRLRASMPPGVYDPHCCSTPPRLSRSRHIESYEVMDIGVPAGSHARRPDFHQQAVGRLVYRIRGTNEFILPPPRMSPLVPKGNGVIFSEEPNRNTSSSNAFNARKRLREHSSPETVFRSENPQHITPNQPRNTFYFADDSDDLF